MENFEAQKRAAIGASVVHLIRSRPASPRSKKPVSSRLNTAPAKPCLLRPDRSISPRIMALDGPRKSGRTSIAMDFACCCASNFVCQCLDPTGCDCSAALFFCSNAETDADFPVVCHMASTKDDKQDFPSRYANYQDATKENIEGFDPNVLKRIKIVHVDSVQEILFELLSLLDNSESIQSCHSIIIDDIDRIASSEDSPISSIFQAMAVAIETSTTIEKFSGHSSMVLVTAESRMEAPWIDARVSLKETQNPPSWMHGNCDYALSLSHWRAMISKEDENGENVDSMIDYSVTKSLGGALKIYWGEA